MNQSLIINLYFLSISCKFCFSGESNLCNSDRGKNRSQSKNIRGLAYKEWSAMWGWLQLTAHQEVEKAEISWDQTIQKHGLHPESNWEPLLVGLFFFFFKSTLLRYNLHTINCRHLKNTIQWVLTNVYTSEIARIIKIQTVSITPKINLTPLCSPTLLFWLQATINLLYVIIS